MCLGVFGARLPAGLVRRVSLGKHVQTALEETHVPLAKKIFLLLIKVRHHRSGETRSAHRFRFRCTTTRQNKSPRCSDSQLITNRRVVMFKIVIARISTQRCRKRLIARSCSKRASSGHENRRIAPSSRCFVFFYSLSKPFFCVGVLAVK